MQFEKTNFEGLYVLHRDDFIDFRGKFIKLHSDKYKFENYKNCADVNVVTNSLAGTFRGMHFQVNQHAETKIINVIQGKIIDFAIDLRENSVTYGKIFNIELSEIDSTSLFIPKGFAHGYQTLEDNTIVAYEVDENYFPESERGINPMSAEILKHVTKPITAVSSKDLKWPHLSEILK